MTPVTRELYNQIQDQAPDVYEMIRDLDTELAELHLAGLVLQRQRMKLIEGFAKTRATARAIMEKPWP